MERGILKEFKESVEMFEEATSVLQGQSYPTMSCWIYFRECIEGHFKAKEITALFGVTIRIYTIAISRFAILFGVKKIHVIAALMDPCQKKLTVLDKYLAKIPRGSHTPDTFILGEYTHDEMHSTSRGSAGPQLKQEVCANKLLLILFISEYFLM